MKHTRKQFTTTVIAFAVVGMMTLTGCKGNENKEQASDPVVSTTTSVTPRASVKPTGETTPPAETPATPAATDSSGNGPTASPSTSNPAPTSSGGGTVAKPSANKPAQPNKNSKSGGKKTTTRPAPKPANPSGAKKKTGGSNTTKPKPTQTQAPVPQPTQPAKPKGPGKVTLECFIVKHDGQSYLRGVLRWSNYEDAFPATITVNGFKDDHPGKQGLQYVAASFSPDANGGGTCVGTVGGVTVTKTYRP